MATLEETRRWLKGEDINDFPERGDWGKKRESAKMTFDRWGNVVLDAATNMNISISAGTNDKEEFTSKIREEILEAFKYKINLEGTDVLLLSGKYKGKTIKEIFEKGDIPFIQYLEKNVPDLRPIVQSLLYKTKTLEEFIEDIDEDCTFRIKLIRCFKRVHAVKVIKELTGWDLRKAKEATDLLPREMEYTFNSEEIKEAAKRFLEIDTRFEVIKYAK